MNQRATAVHRWARTGKDLVKANQETADARRRERDNAERHDRLISRDDFTGYIAVGQETRPSIGCCL